jgi:transcriptional regulator with XRE-family HTH domain
MKIGQIIRERRQEMGRTLESFALEVETDPGNLSRIERGLQQPSEAFLEKAAQALGATVAQLYALAEQLGDYAVEIQAHPDMDSNASKMRRCYAKLTPQNQLLANEIIKLLLKSQEDPAP